MLLMSAGSSNGATSVIGLHLHDNGCPVLAFFARAGGDCYADTRSFVIFPMRTFATPALRTPREGRGTALCC